MNLLKKNKKFEAKIEKFKFTEFIYIQSCIENKKVLRFRRGGSNILSL
jgi:hypothetical protein